VPVFAPPQIRRIVRAMPPAAERQTLLFSATFPPPIQQLAKEFLRPYVWIGVGRVGSTSEGIEQRVWSAVADKRSKLMQVVAALGERSGRSLVFVEKKRSATWVKKMLRNGGASDAPEGERFEPIAAEDIHGDRSQSQREAALASFRAGNCKVLVATDVAARGLDIAGVEHVINMDMPLARDDFDSCACQTETNATPAAAAPWPLSPFFNEPHPRRHPRRDRHP
jgi:superfamily II DNA/RNA helicase